MVSYGKILMEERIIHKLRGNRVFQEWVRSHHWPTESDMLSAAFPAVLIHIKFGELLLCTK
jgi:hypothetical protein